MPKCNFNKVALQIEISLRQECSPINLLHIFGTPFTKNTLSISSPSSLLVTTIFSIFDNNIPRSVEDATLTRSKKRK